MYSVVDFVSIAKFICAYPLAHSRFCVKGVQDLPVKPSVYTGSPYFFEGRLRRAIDCRTMGKGSAGKNLQFLEAWNQAKRGCCVVPKSFVEKALDQHAQNVSQPFVITGLEYDLDYETRFKETNFEDPTQEEEIRLREIHSDDLDCIDLVVNAMFDKDYKLDLKLGECSNRASKEKTILDGGGRDIIRNLTGYDMWNSFLFKMVYHPRLGTKEVRTDLFCDLRPHELFKAVNNLGISVETLDLEVRRQEHIYKWYDRPESGLVTERHQDKKTKDVTYRTYHREREEMFEWNKVVEIGGVYEEEWDYGEVGRIGCVQTRKLEFSECIHAPPFPVETSNMGGFGLLRARVDERGEIDYSYIVDRKRKNAIEKENDLFWEGVDEVLEDNVIVDDSDDESEMDPRDQSKFHPEIRNDYNVSFGPYHFDYDSLIDHDRIYTRRDFWRPDRTVRPLMATVATVIEPLKVRVLTKGEAVPQYLAKPLQKAMWGALKNLKPFELIGREIDTQQVNSVFETMVEDGNNLYNDAVTIDVDKKGNENYSLNQKMFWNSGDFSRATDGLNPWLSQAILKRVLAAVKVPLWYADMCLRDLGNHLFDYGKNSDRAPVFQKKGQLMGSVVSFPILCIMNMVGYMLSVKANKLNHKFSRILSSERGHVYAKRLINNLAVKINGDDILFITDDRGYREWKEIILPHLGFTLSIGKNLVSREFCTMNSRMFRFKRNSYKKVVEKVEVELSNLYKEEEGKLWSRKEIITVETIDCEEVPFLNLSLLKGQGKTSSGNEVVPLWDHHNKCYDSANNKEMMTYFFFRHNEEKIAEMTSNGFYNLYLPRSLGGCGFSGRPKSVTPHQIALASYLYRRHKHLGPISNKDMGLVCERMAFGSTMMDPYKDTPGIRVPLNTVPIEGYKLKPLPATYRAINAGENSDLTIERRYPIDLPKDVRPVRNTEKFYEFSDSLMVMIKSTQTNNCPTIARSNELETSPMSLYSSDLQVFGTTDDKSANESQISSEIAEYFDYQVDG